MRLGGDGLNTAPTDRSKNLKTQRAAQQPGPATADALLGSFPEKRRARASPTIVKKTATATNTTGWASNQLPLSSFQCMLFSLSSFSEDASGRDMMTNLSAAAFWAWFLRAADVLAESFRTHVGGQSLQDPRQRGGAQRGKVPCPRFRWGGNRHSAIRGRQLPGQIIAREALSFRLGSVHGGQRTLDHTDDVARPQRHAEAQKCRPGIAPRFDFTVQCMVQPLEGVSHRPSPQVQVRDCPRVGVLDGQVRQQVDFGLSVAGRFLQCDGDSSHDERVFFAIRQSYFSARKSFP